MYMQRFGGAATALMVIPLLGACGGSGVDEDAWRGALAEREVFIPDDDWATYRDTWVEPFGDDVAFHRFAMGALLNGVSEQWIRINVQHACQDRMDDAEGVFDLVALLDDEDLLP